MIRCSQVVNLAVGCQRGATVQTREKASCAISWASLSFPLTRRAIAMTRFKMAPGEAVESLAIAQRDGSHQLLVGVDRSASTVVTPAVTLQFRERTRYGRPNC